MVYRRVPYGRFPPPFFLGALWSSALSGTGLVRGYVASVRADLSKRYRQGRCGTNDILVFFFFFLYGAEHHKAAGSSCWCPGAPPSFGHGPPFVQYLGSGPCGESGEPPTRRCQSWVRLEAGTGVSVQGRAGIRSHRLWYEQTVGRRRWAPLALKTSESPSWRHRESDGAAECVLQRARDRRADRVYLGIPGVREVLIALLISCGLRTLVERREGAGGRR